MNTASTDDSHIKWGHIIALLVFGGILSVRAVICDSFEAVDIIISWVTKFFETELSSWFVIQGGWVSSFIYLIIFLMKVSLFGECLNISLFHTKTVRFNCDCSL